MLSSLWIRNVALIKNLKVEFGKGLNTLSGETGAGKSIMIDSLNFVLGGKADKTMIRNGEERCVVEAVLELDDSHAEIFAAMEELGLECEDTVILNRSLDVSGKTKCLVNGQTVTVGMLKNFTSLLADIHGQSEHHSLNKISTHLELIDRFAGTAAEQLKADVREKHAAYRAVVKRLDAYGGSEEERRRMIDLISYQVEELERADLKEGEDEELKLSRNKAVNAERIAEALSDARELLKGDNRSSLDTLSESMDRLNRVSQYDEKIEEQIRRLESLKYELEDVAETVSDLADETDFDESDLEEIENRLDVWKAMQRKYGRTYEEISAFLLRSREELERLTNSDAEIAKLKKQLDVCAGELYAAADQLSELRRETARTLETGIMREFQDLGLKNAVFEVRFEEKPERDAAAEHTTANGFDTAEFYMTANLGQPLKPLVKVISGGEASRFMLALKTITSNVDNTPLLVFDEIDTGISGEIAQMVAKKFAAIAKHRQLVAITHLPQIAAMADGSYYIEKHAENGETVTSIVKIGAELKEKEIARLAGGSNIGEHGVLHARELIAWCDKYKAEL